MNHIMLRFLFAIVVLGWLPTADGNNGKGRRYDSQEKALFGYSLSDDVLFGTTTNLRRDLQELDSDTTSDRSKVVKNTSVKSSKKHVKEEPKHVAPAFRSSAEQFYLPFMP